MLSRKRPLSYALLAAGMLLLPHAFAQSPSYPTKPIRLLVGFSASSSVDAAARVVAQRLGESLKQPVIVDNKAGASGILAAQELVHAPSDGHTLMLGTLPQLVIAPLLQKKSTYDAVRDFAPVTALVWSDLVLVVDAKKNPSRTLQEFVAWAKAKSSIFCGTPGSGSVGHFSTYVFTSANAIKCEFIHYKTTPDSVIGLFNGDIDVQFLAHAVAAPHVASGSLRALVNTTPSRSRPFMSVPTLAEAGYPSMQFSSWFGIVAPAGTPESVLERLERDTSAVMADPEVRGKLEAAGLRIGTKSRSEFKQFVEQEAGAWRAQVKALNFKSE